MQRQNNYQIQAGQAKQRFLTYDQSSLIRKLKVEYDDDYIYVPLLGLPYRIHRTTGDTQKLLDGNWVDGNSHGEVMTLMDLVCDCREDRFLTGRWVNMESFGLMFHRSLLEEAPNPTALRYDRNPRGLAQACEAMGGRRLPGPDVGYAIKLFEDLAIGLQFWQSDEEFPPQLRYLWDENAGMYLRYETMYFAVGLLTDRIASLMGAQN